MFDNYTSYINSIEGFLDIAEAELLYKKARLLTTGCVVEIGTWQGKSTASIAFGLRDNSTQGIKVFAVDHHTGSNECHQMFGTKDLWTFPTFYENMKRLDLLGHIVPVVGHSEDVAILCDKYISLLFIDGAHDEPSVIKDLECWYDKIMLGGWLLMHDVYNAPPIERAMKGFLERHKNFVYKERVKSTAVLWRAA